MNQIKNNKIALGAMLFGTKVDEKTSFDLLDAYVDGGGTQIDTADCYAFWVSDSGFGGQSEAVIGRWLAARPGIRDRIQLSTKVGVEPVESNDGSGRVPEGLSSSVIANAIDQSLERLQTDRIDLYWAHKEDRATPLEETVAAFGKIVSDGKALQLGASNHPIWRVEQARGIARATGVEPWTALQLSDSYLRVRPFVRPASENHRFGRVTDEVTDYAASQNLELWAYSPLLGGGYDRPDRPFDQVFEHPGSTRRLAALTEVALELGITRSQLVLAWLVGGAVPRVPIVGVSSIQQVQDALAAVRIELSDDQRARLDSAN